MSGDRRRRDEERQKQLRFMLLLLGFACLIQLFVSLEQSRGIVREWTREREEEARAFDKRVRDETRPAPAEGAR